LAQAWTRGQETDWRTLYAGVQPRRVRLLTYPFAKERCSIVPQALREGVAEVGAIVAQLDHRTTTDIRQSNARVERLIVKGWQPSPLSVARKNLGRVAVVCSDSTARLAQHLARKLGPQALLLDVESIISEQKLLRECTVWVDVSGCGLGNRSVQSICAL